MRPSYAGHYYPADPPYERGTCWGCGKVKPALAWRDDRAPDARLCGRCVPPEVTVAYVTAREHDTGTRPPPAELDELPGQLTIGDAL